MEADAVSAEILGAKRMGPSPKEILISSKFNGNSSSLSDAVVLQWSEDGSTVGIIFELEAGEWAASTSADFFMFDACRGS